MALAYLLDPTNQYQNVAGVNNVAGWFEVFISDTPERADVYVDFAGTLAPERIGIDNDGRAVMIVDSEGAYRVEMHAPNGDLLWTQYPVWPVGQGGGAVGVDIGSSDGSVDVQRTQVGSVVNYDLSVAADNTDLLNWGEYVGYTMDGTHMVPSYNAGTIESSTHGILLKGGQYYHVTAALGASSLAQNVYDAFQVSFKGVDGDGVVSTFATKSFHYDASTGEGHSYDVSFDMMPATDVELYAEATGLESGISVGLAEVYVHRVYSGAPSVPGTVADKGWVEANFQETLVAGSNITIEGNVISASGTFLQQQADWAQSDSSAVDFIKNKPSVPTTTSELTNDSGFITAAEAPVQDVQVDGSSVVDGNGVASISMPDLTPYATTQELTTGLAGKQDVIDDLSTIRSGAASGATAIQPGDLATVATTGAYSDLTGTPDLSVYATTSDLTNGLATKQDTISDLSTIRSGAASGATAVQPGDLATVATTGAYSDLSGTPDLSVYATTTDLSNGLATKQDTISDLSTIRSGAAAGATAVQPGDLATVATTGSYTDLSNTPSIPAALTAGDGITIASDVVSAKTDGTTISVNLNGELVALGAGTDSSFLAQYGMTTYQEIATAVADNRAVFVTGAANALTAVMPMTSFNTNPAMVLFGILIGSILQTVKLDQGVWTCGYENIQADWSETNQLKPSYIANKPANLVQDASYVHTDNNFTNVDVTKLSGIAAGAEVNVQSDWTESDSNSDAYIQNKPVPVCLVAGQNITITESSGSVIIDATAAPQVQADWTESDSSAASYIENKPSLATVATSGSYNDLTDKPSIPPSVIVDQSYDATSTHPQSGTSVAEAISTKQDIISDLSAIRSGAALGTTSVQPSDLATVATTGSYNDLSNRPTLATVANTGNYVDLVNRPDLSVYAETANLATVATTGDYDDLLNKPTIPAAQVNSDWNAASGVAQILNKPDLSVYATSTALTNGLATKQDTISDLSTIRSGAQAGSTAVQPSDLATVATTGNYEDLNNLPTIPAAQVNSDWNAVSGVAEILNKPANLVQDASYVHTDENFTSAEKTKLSGIAAGAEVNVQANWNETDSSSDAYIRNKPTVDQTYSPSSTNAQSGTALAGAIAGVRQVPSSSSSDDGKVLTVDSQGAVGWVTPVVIGTIDLTPQPDPTPTPEPSGNWTTCTFCGGTGTDMEFDETCSNCGGTGLVCAACGGSGVIVTDEYETCGECGGTGMVDYGEGDETCPSCSGTGTVPVEETCSSCEGVGHPTT